jgi:DNA-binding response OmpR family regulator
VTEGSQSALDRPHALIVTDDEGLKSFLEEGLTYGGFWTSAIASGLQTLEVFRLRTFDLVLIDAALQGLDALAVVRRLRGRGDRAASDSPRTDIPILLITADPGEVEPAAAADAGADGILSAPLEIEELVPFLHRVVADWRDAHPGRPMADAAAQRSDQS